VYITERLLNALYSLCNDPFYYFYTGLANVSTEIDQNLTQLRRMDEDFKRKNKPLTE
jgi:hypothetical protein